jgi:Ca2+-binding RTX toxin-like protein
MGTRAVRRLFVPLALACCWAALPVGAAAAAPNSEPTCAEGPARVGGTIEGTPCADRIVVPPGVASVDGGAGNDTIVPAPIPATVESCPSGCHLGVGSQTFEGGPGNDVVFGERGNDTLLGGEGDDQLFGGIGDDLLRGGPGNDRLSGGFGADSIDGEAGDDYVRGDGTIDRIFDTGGGFDTLSYASGVTPGFGGGIATGAENFPSGSEGERGVYLTLGTGGQNGNNGIAALGGGVDEVEAGAFERIVGTPYSDYITGSGAGETIYGGGGADVLRGGGGDDSLHGGADGDLLDGGEGADALEGEAGSDNCLSGTSQTSCEGSAEAVATRDTSKVEVGMTEVAGYSQVYVTGSEGGDHLVATYGASAVSFALSSGSFDTSASAGGGCSVTATAANCPLNLPLDSITIAGMAGEDSVEASSFPDLSGTVLTGGTGNDTLGGGEASEDVLVDGPGAGADQLSALGDDDALLHNGGADHLAGGDGNDLFLSVSICDGEEIDGGAGRDNSSWARLGGQAVDARLDLGKDGEPGAGGTPECSGGALDSLASIEDLEGSEAADTLYGDTGPNQLLGHAGADSYFALAGDDSILANSGDDDQAIDCGEGDDKALIDFNPPYSDPAPVECESVTEAAPNDFRTVTELPPPPAPPPAIAEPPRPPRDRTPPRTRITRHPPKVVRLGRGPRRVAFRFTASEPGSTFSCRLDSRPYSRCRSPRAYFVGRGKHVFRVTSTDPQHNRDRTPAIFRFSARRG